MYYISIPFASSIAKIVPGSMLNKVKKKGKGAPEPKAQTAARTHNPCFISMKHA